MFKAAHFQVRGLLARFDALGPEDGWTKNRLFTKIRQELDLQLKVEEVLSYPAVRKLDVESAQRVVRKALQDHDEIKSLLKELTELSAGNKSLDMKMNALRRCVLHHIELEESQVFPLLRTLPPETLQELSDEMEGLRDGLRMTQRRSKQPQRARELFYPTLQDENGAPKDDGDTTDSLGAPGESNERHPSDFDNWGSE
jgi:iron-sulfur cluster repair protein YtfE (RIC family)